MLSEASFTPSSPEWNIHNRQFSTNTSLEEGKKKEKKRKCADPCAIKCTHSYPGLCTFFFFFNLFNAFSNWVGRADVNSLVFVKNIFSFKTRFHHVHNWPRTYYVNRVVLKLWLSSCLGLRSAGIIGLHHHVWPCKENFDIYRQWNIHPWPTETSKGSFTEKYTRWPNSNWSHPENFSWESFSRVKQLPRSWQTSG